MTDLINKLNDNDINVRLDALREIKKLTDDGKLPKPADTPYVNNHIHTQYSFSPYSPTKALYMAWQEGLKTAGIMDHDSVGGIREFIEAGKILQMPITCGMEIRCDMSGTTLNGKKINNPDQKSVAYVALHGIPHQSIDMIEEFIKPYRAKRNERNRKMCKNITELVAPYGLDLDFDRDVLPLSKASEGGSVTERHILFALAKKVTAKYPTPAQVVDFFKNDMHVAMSAKVEAQILNGENTPDFYEYDILGALKAEMVEKFYIDADEECPSVYDYIDICNKSGAISAYAYLGDVGDSVTGDKKAQKFEDDYLPLLFDTLKELGFDAVTYMPTRNTEDQLKRVMSYCDRYNLFQISGVDINSPRQEFICRQLDNPLYAHLVDATYALIGAENEATKDLDNAMFSEKTIIDMPAVKERIAYYKNKA